MPASAPTRADLKATAIQRYEHIARLGPRSWLLAAGVVLLGLASPDRAAGPDGVADPSDGTGHLVRRLVAEALGLRASGEVVERQGGGVLLLTLFGHFD